MKKSFWVILIIGIILRIALSLSTYHPDIQVFDLSGQILKTGNILTFYDYLYQLDKGNLMVKNFPPHALNYPPATYFLLGGSSLIFTSITPASVHWDFLFKTKSVLGNIFLNLHLLALKLPYFIFDLGCAYLLYNFFDDLKDKFMAFTLWMFNPIILYATYMMGQYDIIATFFVILSLYIVKKEKEYKLNSVILASFFLGVGVAFKIYPVLFLIPLVALTGSWKDRIKIILAGLFPFILTSLPFLSSSGYRTNALFANQLSKSFFAQIPISGGESIILFVAAVIVFYFIFLNHIPDKVNLWKNYFLVILLFFIFTHFHPQWFLWLSPFLIIEMVKTKFKNVFVSLTLFVSWFFMLFFFDSSLTLGLFAPLNPLLYQSKTLWEQLFLNIDYNFSRSILQTIFAGGALFFVYNNFPKAKSDS